MKKLFTLMLTVLMSLTAVFGLTACGNKLTGFDIELAREVVAYLNEEYDAKIKIEFQEIDWNSKEALLENGTIDLVWNGMTITAERAAEMCISVPYLYNKQVAVVRKDDVNKYSNISLATAINLKDATFGAEAGSAGEDVVKVFELLGAEYISSSSQLDALTSLDSGNVDIAIIDSVMAGYYTSQGTYKDKLVMIDNTLATESYGIAAKKGNFALVSKINEALIALRTTKYADVAADFGLTSSIALTENTVDVYKNASDDSWDKVVASKKLVIGYTVFAPIAYTK